MTVPDSQPASTIAGASVPETTLDPFYYDDLGRLISQQQPPYPDVQVDPNGLTLALSTTTSYASSSSYTAGIAGQRHMSSVWNGDFHIPPMNATANIDATNNLPNWTAVQLVGTSITVALVADTNSGSGYFCRFTATAAVASDETYLEAMVPVVGTRDQEVFHVPSTYGVAQATGANLVMYLSGQYMKSDQVTTTGTAQEVTDVVPSFGVTVPLINGGAIPTDAGWLRLRLGTRAAGASTATQDIAYVAVNPAKAAYYVVDSNPAYDPASITQSSGVLAIRPNGTLPGATTELKYNAATPGTATDNLTILFGNKDAKLAIQGGHLEVAEIASPSTPGVGYSVYAKSDHHLYGKDTTGLETDYTAGSNLAIASNIVLRGPTATQTVRALGASAGAVGLVLQGTGTQSTDYFGVKDASGNPVLAVSSNANVVVGNVAIQPTGAKLQTVDGISFPATQVASTNLNTLDDYEESAGDGTGFVPTVTFVTPGDLSVVYSQRAADYTKIGKLVLFNIRIQTSTFTFTTASGSMQVTGLPFTSGTATFYGNVLIGGYTSAGFTQIIPNIGGSSTSMTFIASGTGVAAATLAATEFRTATNVTIRCQGWYLASA